MNGNQRLVDTVTWKPMPGTAAESVAVRDLIDQIVEGAIDESSLVSVDGLTWRPIATVPPLAEAFEAIILRRRVRAEEETTVDLAPMIDVIFLLLLFFMFAATYEKQKTIETPPPPPEGVAARPTLEELQEQYLLARVTTQGALTLDGQAVSWEQVRQTIKQSIRDRKTTRLIIIAAEQTDWEWLVRLQDEANLAGIERILFGKGVPPGRE